MGRIGLYRNLGHYQGEEQLVHHLYIHLDQRQFIQLDQQLDHYQFIQLDQQLDHYQFIRLDHCQFIQPDQQLDHHQFINQALQQMLLLERHRQNQHLQQKLRVEDLPQESCVVEECQEVYQEELEGNHHAHRLVDQEDFHLDHHLLEHRHHGQLKVEDHHHNRYQDQCHQPLHLLDLHQYMWQKKLKKKRKKRRHHLHQKD